MRIILLSASFAGMLAWSVVAGAESTSEGRKMVDFLVTGIRDSRERLRQGVVQGTGQHTVLYGDGQTLKGDVGLFFAFDWDKRLYRCEREEPRLMRSGALKSTRQIYFRQPGRSVQYVASWREIQILREDVRVPRSLFAFDLRAVGLLYQDGYRDQLSYGKILDLYTAHEPSEAVDEGAGVYRMRWILDDVVRRTIWVNRREGFSITRFEVSDKRAPAMPLADDGWPFPYVVNQATWTQVDSVWVPKTFRIEDRTGVDDTKAFWRYEHVFDWKSVNEPLSDDLFNIDELGAKQGTLVVNYQGKAPIVERLIGRDNTRIEGESPRKAFNSESSARSAHGFPWLLAANVGLVVWLLGVFARRMFRHHRAH